MIERSQDAGFTTKPCPAIVIEWMAPGENLDRDVAAEPRVSRAVDLTHAAGAEQLLDLIGAEPRTAHEAWRHIERALITDRPHFPPDPILPRRSFWVKGKTVDAH